MVALSHITLQRVIVRMLFDPAFAQSVADRPHESLSGLGLDERDISLLTAKDPRAWRLDPHRRARSLEALLDEYPTSGALIARTTASVAALDAFFSSPEFHQCIQQRQRLALSFGGYLMAFALRLGRRDIYGLAVLEQAIATFRRPRPDTNDGNGELYLGRHVALVSVPEGTLEAYVALTHTLASKNLTGAAVVVSSTLTLEPQSTSEENVFVLLETLADGSGPSLSVLEASLGHLLESVRGGLSVKRFDMEVRRQGADPGEEAEILASLIDDGLIARSSSPGPVGAS